MNNTNLITKELHSCGLWKIFSPFFVCITSYNSYRSNLLKAIYDLFIVYISGMNDMINS